MRDGVGRLGALGDPGVDLLEVQLDGLRVGQRVVAADQLDVATVAGHTAVSDDDAVERTLLGTVTGQTNLDCQLKLLQTCGASIRDDRRVAT